MNADLTFAFDLPSWVDGHNSVVDIWDKIKDNIFVLFNDDKDIWKHRLVAFGINGFEIIATPTSIQMMFQCSENLKQQMEDALKTYLWLRELNPEIPRVFQFRIHAKKQNEASIESQLNTLGVDFKKYDLDFLKEEPSNVSFIIYSQSKFWD